MSIQLSLIRNSFEKSAVKSINLWKLKEIRCYECEDLWEFDLKLPHTYGNVLVLLFGNKFNLDCLVIVCPTEISKRIIFNVLTGLTKKLNKLEDKCRDQIALNNIYKKIKYKGDKNQNIKAFISLLKYLCKRCKNDLDPLKDSNINNMYQIILNDQKKNIFKIYQQESFCEYLFSPDNQIIDASFLENIYQPDDQPLHNYFIYSSHNTYLTGDQFKSESSVESYVRCLTLGVRCIELDCWDGSKEPVIKHGYTLTKEISFKAVIKVIKKYAFVTSNLPLILSIENHCSASQENIMISCMIYYLGEMIQTFINIEDTFIPLNKLKNKIIIKAANKLCDNIKSYSYENEFIIESWFTNTIDRFEAERMLNDPALKDGTFLVRKSQNSTNYVISIKSGNRIEHILIRNDDQSYNKFFIKEGINFSSLRKMVIFYSIHKLPIDTDNDLFLKYPYSGIDKTDLKNYDSSSSHSESSLSSVTSYQDIGINSIFDIAGLKKSKLITSKFSFSEIVSFSDSKLKKLRAKILNGDGISNLEDENKKMFRCYPKGSRIDSSNFSPNDAWNLGIQMVALNFQTPDINMHLNRTFFEDNGKSGYILMPKDLIQKKNIKIFRVTPSLDIKLKLNMTIICLKNISSNLPLQTISPFVEANIYGAEVDKGNHNSFRTATVENNFISPIWNTSHTFELYHPELDIIYLSLQNGYSFAKSQSLGYIALKPLILREGIRCIRVKNNWSENYFNAIILLKIKILH